MSRASADSALLKQASQLLKQEKYSEVLQLLAPGRERSPAVPKLEFLRAQALISLKMPYAAYVALRQELRHFPDPASEKILTSIRSKLSIEPADPMVDKLLELAPLLREALRRGEHKQFIEHSEPLTAQGVAPIENLHCLRCRSFQALEQHDLALEAAILEIANYPAHGEALVHVAELTRVRAAKVCEHYKAGQYQKCLDLSENMLRWELIYPRLHWMRAQCYLQLGDTPAAEKELNQETAEWPWIPEETA